MQQQTVSTAWALTAALAIAGSAATEGFAQSSPQDGASVDGAAPVGALTPWSIAGHGVLCGATTGGGRFDRGAVFCLASDGGEERLLHSFTGGATDGAEPVGGLVRSRDGSLYGVTSGGGRCEGNAAADRSHGCGTLFRITAAGTEQLAHIFSGLIEPSGGLIEASDGSFLGIGPDQIYRVAPDGTETVLHSFRGGRTDGSEPSGVVEAANGIFYGTTRSGGAFNHGAIFALTATGDESLLYSFRGGTDGDFPSAPPIQGRDGALYGITTYGGANPNMATLCDRGCGTVFRVTLEGKETVLHAFRGGMLDGVHPTSSLLQSSDGTLYGTTSGGGNDIDIGVGTVFQIVPNGQLRMLYAFRDENEGVFPSALVRSADGDLYGTAGGGRFGQGVVFRITASGRMSIAHAFGQAAKAHRQ
jgi:uncharacterized repeat protein (TIGR03803 family)